MAEMDWRTDVTKSLKKHLAKATTPVDIADIAGLIRDIQPRKDPYPEFASATPAPLRARKKPKKKLKK